jgi:hypothetical protein
MHMYHFRLRHIGNRESLFLRPFGPSQVLQPGQGFIVRVFLPQAFADSGIGIVAKSGLLIQFTQIGIPLMKNLLF